MKILEQELVHWKNVGVGAGVAAQGMKQFYTKVLILEYEQKKNLVVMTIFYLPERYLHQLFADQSSWENLPLVSNRQQMNLQEAFLSKQLKIDELHEEAQ